MFLALALAAGCVYGRAARKSDYLNVGVNGGYNVLLGKSEGMKVPGGFAGGFHIGYEYREGRFWFGAGGALQYAGSSCESNIQVSDVWFEDTRMMAARMKYTMNSPRKETQNWGLARLYIEAGYTTGNHNGSGFYIGGGLRLGGKFDLRNTSTVKYTTTAEYDKYYEEYEDMPNHFYTVNDVQDTVKFGTVFCMTVAVEGGWDLKISRCNRMKVGLFVEAGINNVMEEVTTRQPWVDEKNVSRVKPYSAYNSEAMKGKFVVPVTAGVRVSFLMNMSRVHSRCKMCPCYRKR